MAVPYFNSHSLNPDAQKAYGPAVSNSGSVLNDCSRRSGVVFGMEVQQTAPSSYLNASNPYGESFHNPFSDYRFPKVLVRVLYHQESTQSEPLGLSNKTKVQQSDENILYTGQSGFRIDRVWSMAVKANTQSHSINANHFPLDSTLKDTAGNGSSGVGRSTLQISSVVDNTSQQAYLEPETRKTSRKAYEQSEKGKASRKAYRQSDEGKTSRKTYEQSDKGKAARKAYEQSEKGKAARKAYRQSDKGMASSKAYEQSEKRQASRKAYRQSEKGRASRKAYEQSEKGKAARKAYEQSEQRKASRKAYLQSDEWKAYQKAYHKVFKNTGDREQAKIAGKQAVAIIRQLKKVKNSELESISISPLTPRLSG